MITSLDLKHFRSYVDASFALDPGVNIVAGPNGSGKTNLLEAILVTLRGGSYRAKDSELVAFGAPWARLDAIMTDNSRRTVKIKVADDGSVAKQFEVDERLFTRLPATRTLPVVLFEPNHLLLLSSSPDLRRVFLDDLIEQTNMSFGAVRRHYKRVLSQRNSLLKKNPKDIAEQLFIWNVRLSELGGKIARERQALIERFATQMSETYSELADRPSDVQLQYVSPFPSSQYETALLSKLEASTSLDVLRGFTAYGPHRDDMAVHINGHPVQGTASRGETRTLVLALKLLEVHIIEAARQMRPILLLDDVFSELDARRRTALTKSLGGYQSCITTTDADIVARHFSGHNVISVKLA